METERAFSWSLLKEIVLRPGVLAVSGLYASLQLAFNLISWTGLLKNQSKYPLVQLITWRVWIVITPLLTLLLIALIVRAAIQVIAKRDDEIRGMRMLLDGGERRKKIRGRLGEFLEARDAFSYAPGFSLDHAERQALKQLDSEIRVFLSQELDASYASRFTVDPLNALQTFIKELGDLDLPKRRLDS